jgi:hypothetical protein
MVELARKTPPAGTQPAIHFSNLARLSAPFSPARRTDIGKHKGVSKPVYLNLILILDDILSRAQVTLAHGKSLTGINVFLPNCRLGTARLTQAKANLPFRR